MSGLLNDLRYAWRTFAKSPGFVSTAVVSLALGIGINTAIFSVIHTAMERPVSARAPEQLVDLSLRTPGGVMPFTFPEYQEVRNRARVFSEVMALMRARYRLSGQGAPEFIEGLAATPNFFTGFSQAFALGRGFSQPEGEAVLSHGFWKRRFGGDPGVIGKPLVLHAGPTRFTYSIAGVLPPDFRHATMWPPDVVVPLPDDPLLRRGDVRPLSLMARVKPAVPMGQARAATEALATQLAPLFPDSFGKARLVFQPKVRRDARTRAVAAIVQTVVGLVLLIACANVMNLLLARHQARRAEMATRVALGASAARLMRQLLMESLLLALPAALAGYGLAVLTIQVVERIPIPGLTGLRMYFYLDQKVLAFALSAGVLASLIAGLWPARAAAKLDLVPALKGAGAAVGRRKLGVRGVLVAAQLALSLVGITAAAMLTRGVWTLSPFDPGVDPHRVLAATLWPAMNGYTGTRAAELVRRLESRLGAQADVQAVAFAASVPGADGRMEQVLNTGSALLPKQEVIPVVANSAAPGFFRFFGIHLLRGREFSASDEGGPPRCLLNATMAQRFFPGQDPLGRTLRVGGLKGADHEVIGVARDSAYDQNGNDHFPLLYLPLAKAGTLAVFLRTAGPAGPLAETVRRTVAALDPEMPLLTVGLLADRLTGGPMATELRLRAGVMGTLGGTALLLSALGLYGVIAYLVSRRTREIGIRLALGARRLDVLRAVLKDGLRLVAAGMALGVACSLLVCPLLASRLFGVTPNHPAVIAAGCGILAAVAAAAMLIPARRASKIQALTALRYE